LYLKPLPQPPLDKNATQKDVAIYITKMWDLVRFYMGNLTKIKDIQNSY
jgi:hypothetical protein